MGIAKGTDHRSRRGIRSTKKSLSKSRQGLIYFAVAGEQNGPDPLSAGVLRTGFETKNLSTEARQEREDEEDLLPATLRALGELLFKFLWFILIAAAAAL